MELGYPYLDADRAMDVFEGMEIRYLILSTTNRNNFNRLRALIVREREREEAEGGRGFDRIGIVVSADMDVHLNAGWFEMSPKMAAFEPVTVMDGFEGSAAGAVSLGWVVSGLSVQKHWRSCFS